MYKFSPQAPKKERQSEKKNFWGVQWINGLVSPELQWEWSVQILENYFIEWEWKLVKRKWITEFFSSAVWKPVRMLEKFSDNIIVFSAWNEVFYYTLSTDTITSIWTYWEATDDDFVWEKYWDYLYFTNWTWKIQYVTFDYEQINLTWNNIVWTWWYVIWWEWSFSIAVINTPASFDITNISWTTTGDDEKFIILQWEDIFLETTPVWRISSIAAWWTADFVINIIQERWDPYTIQSSDQFNIYNQCLTTNDFDNITIKHTNTNSNFTFKFWIPISTENLWKYKISYTFNWTSWLSSDLFTNSWFSEELVVNDMISATNYTEFLNWDWWEIIFRIRNNLSSWLATYTLTDLFVSKQSEISLASWELLESPVWAKRLLVFSDTDWARLYAWNTRDDLTEIKYSILDQVKNLWEVAFKTWTSSNEPLLRTDPWWFTNSNLWELKDFWILNNEVIAFFEDWKKAFSIQIDTVQEWTIAIQVQKIVSRERQDFWWERWWILTAFGIFYTNESWIWQMTYFWNDLQWWTDQDVNITRVLWENAVDLIDWTNCSMVFDNVKWVLLVTCREKTSTENNLIFWYNPTNRSFWKITWWKIERFLKFWENIYWSSSQDTKVLQLFDWHTDENLSIWATFEKEIPLTLWNLHRLNKTTVKWSALQWEILTLNFDIYDKFWNYQRNILSWELYADHEWQVISIWNTLIPELSRLVMRLTNTWISSHEINYILLETQTIWENTTEIWFTTVNNLIDWDWWNILDSNLDTFLTT